MTNAAERDLFEELQARVGCDYISDLRYSPWRELARREIAGMDLRPYPLKALNDAAVYLYSDLQHFAGAEAAGDCFKSRCSRKKQQK